MCQWRVATRNADMCGGRRELEARGMMSVRLWTSEDGEAPSVEPKSKHATWTILPPLPAPQQEQQEQQEQQKKQPQAQQQQQQQQQGGLPVSTTPDNGSGPSNLDDNPVPAEDPASAAAPVASSMDASGTAGRTEDTSTEGGRTTRPAASAESSQSPIPPSGLKRSRVEMEAGAAKAAEEVAGGEGDTRGAPRGSAKRSGEASGRVVGSGGDATPQQQQQQPEKSDEEAPWLNSPRHEGGTGGGGGGRRAVAPPPRGALVGTGTSTGTSKGRGKVVGMPQQAKARVVHIMYDHNTLVTDLEVRGFGWPPLFS